MSVRRALDSLSAEKKLAAQNLPRVKLFKSELDSRRYSGHENTQKQANCERCLSGIGQLKREEEAGCPKASTREDIYGGIGQLKSGEEAGCPKSSTREDIYGGIGQLKRGEEAGCPESSTREAI